MDEDFYIDFDRVYMQIEELLGNFRKSKILQKYFRKQFVSFFYGNLINNFFDNLTQENIIEFNLPRGKISKIKNRYKDIRNEIKSALSMSSKNGKVDEKFYYNFKLTLKDDFPEFLAVMGYIENEIDIKKAKKYLKKRESEFINLGSSEENLNLRLSTAVIEAFVQDKGCQPLGTDIKKIMKNVTKESLSQIAPIFMKSLKKNRKRMLKLRRKVLHRFESRLYKRWKEPLDLLECMMKVSLESGEEQQKKIIDNKNNFKIEALLKIHARALHISNEILVLLKAGYADGANARWRSLHELAIIALFLSHHQNEVSKRYLEHHIVKAFKEAEDYRKYYKKLGYPPFDRVAFNKLKRDKEELCRKYGKNFKADYGWIPSSIMPCINFRELEKKVKLDHWHPFYNLSSDAVHGGSKGFYRLGLMDDYQEKIMLVGPSNYGLADVMQISSFSLLRISISMLKLQLDFDSLIQMQILCEYAWEIGPKAVEIQKKIEEDEN